MRLSEYMAMELLGEQGLPTPRGRVITRADEARDIPLPAVLKAQIPAGGRGKAGGVRFVETADEAVEIAGALLGGELNGYRVERLLAAEKVEHEAEWYLSISLDRALKAAVIMFSPRGGVDIESAGGMVRLPVPPFSGIKPWAARYLLAEAGLPAGYEKALDSFLRGLYALFCERDCLLCEINPLAVAGDRLIALDGKIEVDDSALYRQEEIAAWRAELGEAPLIVEAREYGFLYIPIVAGARTAVASNGSGMLMSCMDALKAAGREVAAGLDLGGGATKEKIAEALRILFKTPGVTDVLINIFGGITRCDEVAGGVRLASERGDLAGKRIALRMEGTNRAAGLEIARQVAGVSLADDLAGCVAVLAKGGERA